MPNKPSSSNLYRGIKCPASYELKSRETEWRPPQVQAAANKGTAIHRFLEEVGIGVPYVTALERVKEEWRGLASNINIPRVIPFGGRHEVAWKYNVQHRTVEELGVSKNRDYGDLTMTEVPGTVDWYKVENDHALIRDYKTGTFNPEPDIKVHAQLSFFSSAIQIHHGQVKKLRHELVWIDKKGKETIEGADVSVKMLNVYRDKLYSMHMGRISARKSLKNGNSPKVTEGSWCRYCPAFKACPIKTKKREEKARRKAERDNE